jgi:hypothetical protein
MLRGSHVRVVPSDNPYIVSNGLNVTSSFQEFQRASILTCSTQVLILETHPYHVLSLSSILLLKPEQYGDLFH